MGQTTWERTYDVWDWLFERHEYSAVFPLHENKCSFPSLVHTKLTVLMHIGNFMSHLEGKKWACPQILTGHCLEI